MGVVRKRLLRNDANIHGDGSFLVNLENDAETIRTAGSLSCQNYEFSTIKNIVYKIAIILVSFM